MNFAFSIEQVCSLTGMGRTKLYEAINAGELKAKKWGKRTIVLKEDVERFLKDLPQMQANEELL